MIPRNVPLRTSIPMVLVALMLAFQIGLSWIDFLETDRKHTSAAKDRARLLALLISAETESQLRVGNRAVVHDIVAHAINDRDVRASFLVDDEDRITLARPFELEGARLAETSFASLAPLAATCRETLVGQVVEAPERRSVIAAYPAATPAPGSGFFPTETLVLFIEYDLERARAEAVREARRQVATNAIAALTAAALLWMFLRQAVLVRFQKLLSLARRVGAGDFSARASLSGGDEVAQLGAEFDAMARRLETSEERFGRQHRWFRELIEHSSDILIVLEPSRRILFAGAAAESALGLPPEALEGRQLEDFVHEADRYHLERALTLEREGEPNAGDRLPIVRMLRPDGAARVVELACALATTPEGGPALVVNARDVTERQRLEDELFQSRKLQAVGQLAAGVAHDFNNLLTAIRGSAELMEHQIAGQPSLVGLNEVIVDSVDRGTALTQQLLLFGRKQEGRLEPIDLNAVIQGFRRLARAVVGDIVIEEHLQRPLTPILGDSVRLGQILLNLLQNAKDAIEGEGTIRIETHNLDSSGQVTADSMAPRIRLRVSDTGVGMDAEERRRMFEPFFTSKPPGEGTGLGLAVVYGAVRALSGTIEVESEVGRGTTVDIVWPTTAEGLTEDSEAPSAVPPRGSGERILVVDDEESVRTFVARLLERHGYGVVVAASGRVALERLREGEDGIDAIVTDIVMPEVDGLELLETLRREGRSTAVLLMTGYIEHRPRIESIRELPVGLIDKPFTSRELLTALHELLTRRRAAC